MMDLAAYLLHEEPVPSDDELLEQIEGQIAENAPPSLIDEMEQKIAGACAAGIKLAREHGDRALMDNVEKSAEELEKVAIFPLIAGAAARLVGGQVAKKGLTSMAGSLAKDVGKNLVVDKATSVASNALNRARQPAQQAAPMVQQGGGFKYANFSAAAGKFLGGLGGKGPGTFGQKIVGGMVRNPGAALVGAGMVGGAIMAPRDPVTGEKQYLRGAAMGGAMGGGAYALGAGNSLRRATMRNKDPLFGAGVRDYARSSVQATGNSAQRIHNAVKGPIQQATPPVPHNAGPVSGTPVAPEAASGPPTRLNTAYNQGPIRRGSPAPESGWNQGPVSGGPGGSQAPAPRPQRSREELFSAAARSGGMTPEQDMAWQASLRGPATVVGRKLAHALEKTSNRQTLSYDPATKSFTRTHVTPSLASNSQVRGGGTLASPGLELANIPAGRSEPVVRDQVAPRGPAPAGLAPSPGPSQTFSSHGGSVLSSTPASGVAARPQTMARPMAVPPPLPAAAKMKGSPISGGMGAAIRTAPKPPALPSLAGARSLVR